MKYRKKPVVIEAIQIEKKDLFGEMEKIVNFVGEDNLDFDYDTSEVFISTLEGNMKLSPDDYIIKGVQGEFYPCKPDIFEATYEKERS